MRKNRLDELYFGIMYWDTNSKGLVKCNLFAIPRIQFSIAHYIVNKDKDDFKISNPLFFCFGDVQGRCEWEFAVDALGAENMNQSSQKVDVYSMYVLPNKDYLMELVNSISIYDARKVLKRFE